MLVDRFGVESGYGGCQGLWYVSVLHCIVLHVLVFPFGVYGLIREGPGNYRGKDPSG